MNPANADYSNMTGVYWTGADGNTYVKDWQGTRSIGQLNAGTAASSGISKGGYTYIQDPVAAQSTSQINTGSGSGANQSQVNLINSAFGTKKAGLQSQLDVLNPAQKAAEAQTLNSYQRQSNELDQNLALGQKNLGIARDTVNEKKVRSLDDLGRQFRSAIMGYANQLGAMGAGDSSAGQLINQALGGQVSRNRGDVMGNAANQLSQIQGQEDSLSLDFNKNKGALDDWKTSTINQIGMDFAEKRNAIMNAMADADYEQQRQLAQYDAANVQSAINRLGALEGQYAQQARDLTARYQNIFAPTSISMDPSYQNYEVKPIDSGTLAGLRMPSYVNPENPVTAALTKRRAEDQLTGLV